MTIARHVRVTGRVQGVFFRAWTKEQADALGATGWVRNCADGAVEAHVEGDEGAVRKLIDRMRSGPSQASVETIESDDAAHFNGRQFEIRH